VEWKGEAMKRIVVGITGASGVIMGFYLLEALKRTPDCEVHLVMTRSAQLTWQMETDFPLETLTSLADIVHNVENMTALIASGSFRTDSMVVIPCSMKSLAGIVNGYAENLLLRAADVCMKENRKLILVPREMPLGKLHLQNLTKAAELGCVLVPPMLTFYNAPDSVEHQIKHVVGKVLMQLDIPYDEFVPWKGAPHATNQLSH